MAVNKVIYGGNTVIDLTGDTVTSDSLVEGVVAHDKSGKSITGTNPYEKTATDTEITSQADLIAQIQTALEGKTAGGGGGGGSVETCTVKYNGIGAYFMYTTVDDSGAVKADCINNNSATVEVVCNTVAVLCYNGNSLNNGTYTCNGVEMIRNHTYYAGFFVTASAGETATIYYTGSSCCFVAGTPVLVSLNGTTAPIETFKVGDDVISYNIKTGENYVSKVKRVVVHEKTTDMADVLFANGATITMNAYHPIYTKDGFHSLTRYCGYDELVVGDVAKTVDGWTEVVGIKRYQSEPIVTYNLDVADIGESIDDNTNDTYYANGIVVHNPVSC